MRGLMLEPRAGPCDSAREIEDWIDELLDLRLTLEEYRAAVEEIDYHLRQAVTWLAEREAGHRCA